MQYGQDSSNVDYVKGGQNIAGFIKINEDLRWIRAWFNIYYEKRN